MALGSSKRKTANGICEAIEPCSPCGRRRKFITLFGGAAASSRRWRWVGLLHPGSQAYLVAPFREGLKEKRYVEGQNVTIEYRWANGHYDQLQTQAADLVQRRASKAATATIPIIFNVGEDPNQVGPRRQLQSL